MHLKRIVRQRLEDLAEYVDAHGEGALRGRIGAQVFSQAQAETYLRFYNGYKREVQEQSLELGLIDPDDPLYGWGWLAQHEPKVRLVGALQHHEILLTGEAYKEQALLQKRAQNAELHVVKRTYIVHTMPMWIMRATLSPIIIPNVRLTTVKSRIQRVKGQVSTPGMAEKVNNLRCFEVPTGIEVRPSSGPDCQIGPIIKNSQVG